MSAARSDYPRSNVVMLVRCPKCGFRGPQGEACVMCELLAGEQS